jgi:hypothetical protein
MARPCVVDIYTRSLAASRESKLHRTSSSLRSLPGTSTRATFGATKPRGSTTVLCTSTSFVSARQGSQLRRRKLKPVPVPCSPYTIRPFPQPLEDTFDVGSGGLPFIKFLLAFQDLAANQYIINPPFSVSSNDGQEGIEKQGLTYPHKCLRRAVWIFVPNLVR